MYCVFCQKYRFRSLFTPRFIHFNATLDAHPGDVPKSTRTPFLLPFPLFLCTLMLSYWKHNFFPNPPFELRLWCVASLFHVSICITIYFIHTRYLKVACLSFTKHQSLRLQRSTLLLLPALRSHPAGGCQFGSCLMHTLHTTYHLPNREFTLFLLFLIE